MIPIMIDLPWATPPVSSNNRGGHFLEASRRKQAKIQAGYAIRQQKIRPVPEDWGPLSIGIHLMPPTRRRRDPDNLALCLKVCIDALVDTRMLPADDTRHVEHTYQQIHPKTSTPRMWLQIQPINHHLAPLDADEELAIHDAIQAGILDWADAIANTLDAVNTILKERKKP